MTSSRISREHLEVLADNTSDRRLSTEFLEVLVSNTAQPRLSQEQFQVLVADDSDAQVSMEQVQVLVQVDDTRTYNSLAAEFVEVLAEIPVDRGGWGRPNPVIRVSTFISTDQPAIIAGDASYAIPNVFNPGAVAPGDVLVIGSINTSSNQFATADAGPDAPFSTQTSSGVHPYGTVLWRKYDGTETSTVSLTAPGGGGRKTLAWVTFSNAQLGQIGTALAGNNTLPIPQDIWFSPGEIALIIAWGNGTSNQLGIAPAPWRTHIRQRDGGPFCSVGIYSWVCDVEGLAPSGNIVGSGTGTTAGVMMAKIQKF